MLLNCDLGESYGKHIVGSDAEVMPYIDQASIACGFHGGDPLTIRTTLDLAIQHGVQVGAHPSYPDREGFGRRSMALSQAELIASLHYQIAALEGMALAAGTTLSYVKPHGALYNDMMTDDTVRQAVIAALQSYHRPLALMLQATPHWQTHAQELRHANIEALFEAFADRRYMADGSLMPRSEAGAVLHSEDILQQAQQLLRSGTVVSASGTALQLHAQTLCVHGDNPAAVAVVAAIRALLDSAR